MSIRSYRDIKSTIFHNKALIAHLEKRNIDPKTIEEIKAEQAEDLKKDTREFYHYQQKYYPDPLSVPICNNKKEWRTVSDDNGETCTDFIIIPDRWSDLWGTDEEQEIYDDIEDFIFSTVGCYSAYEFPTGRMITLRWAFKRVPCGVAITHERGIDW